MLVPVVTYPTLTSFKTLTAQQGMMIRTGLLKDASWSLNRNNRFGATEGFATFGTGVTWEEVSYSASQHNKIVASGWCGSVGIAGETTD